MSLASDVHAASRSYLTAGWRATLFRYLLPVLAMLAIFGVAYYFDLNDRNAPHLLVPLAVAVAVSAWFGGALPGWISVVLATITVDYFMIVPRHVVNLDQKALLWSVAFLVLAITSNILSLQRRRIERELRRSHDVLDTRVRDRTAELENAYESLRIEALERVAAEESERRMRRELARAARITTLGVLTASIAHEVNQPLAAILANAQAARNWLQQCPPAMEQAKESVLAVIGVAERTSAVVGGVRKLMEKGTPVQEAVDLNEVVSQVLTLVRHELQSRNIDLQVRYDPALPSVRANLVALQQVVLNAIMNGIDAMEDVSGWRKELAIGFELIDDEKIAMMIGDSGKGIAQQNVDHIFEPFYSTKPNGIGMGLSICRLIAETYGGRISMAPRSPHGTIFSLILPIAGDEP